VFRINTCKKTQITKCNQNEGKQQIIWQYNIENGKVQVHISELCLRKVLAGKAVHTRNKGQHN